MTDDPVARTARALRETANGSSDLAASSRRRVVATATARRRRRHKVVVALAPLAAALVVSSAWAAVTGRLPRWIDALRSKPESSLGAPVPRAPVAPTRALPAEQTTVPRPDQEADAGVAAEVQAQPTIPPAHDVPIAHPRPATAAAAPPASATASPSPAEAESTAVSEEEALYAVAHRAHFVSKDPVAALRGWDAYIAAYPNGRFALEARYNRALSLVRLGRLADARNALSPFADGRAGGYREKEARELLDALSPDAGR